VNGVTVSQRRVIAVDAKTGRVLAIPLHSPETFTVRDGRTRRLASEFSLDIRNVNVSLEAEAEAAKRNFQGSSVSNRRRTRYVHRVSATAAIFASETP